MNHLKKRIADLNRIIAGCERGSAASCYYIGRRDEVKAILRKMEVK